MKLKVMVVLLLAAGCACAAGFVDLHNPSAIEVDGRPAKPGVVTLSADGTIRIASAEPISKVTLEWKADYDGDMKLYGDVWERTYGASGWHRLDGKFRKRPLDGWAPWYFLISDGKRTDGYGVAVQPGAFASWLVTTNRILLALDVRSGSHPVRLGSRTLEACRLVSRRGADGEREFLAAREFAKLMCPEPRLPKGVVYGYNDWYCAYGHNSATNFLADFEFVASLVKGEKNRPYAVADDGWQALRTAEKGENAKRWTSVNAEWGMPMDEFARRVKALNAHPGLWYRPFVPDEGASLKGGGLPIDPTDPKWERQMRRELGLFCDWGMEIIKIDFITFDWGFSWGYNLGESPVRVSLPKWADDTRTTAEVIRGHYRVMREAVGDRAMIIGCNAIDHFAAGLFEVQRTGDDTSGREWERTRKMGPNTLGMRAHHNGVFYLNDGDCVGMVARDSMPWELNRRWLDLAARSGTALFLSWRRGVTTPEMKKDLEKALRTAAKGPRTGEPLDWTEVRLPTRWDFADGKARYAWNPDFAAIKTPAWAEKRIAAAQEELKSWKGKDDVVAIATVADIHSWTGEFDSPLDWKDHKLHVILAQRAAKALGCRLFVDLGDIGLDCFKSYLEPADRDWAESRLRAHDELYRDFDLPFIQVTGNHDRGREKTCPLTNAEFGNRFNRRRKNPAFALSKCGTWGYYDIPGKMTRVVFLNTSEQGGGIGGGQIEFLKEALATAGGRRVIVMSHVCLHLEAGKWMRYGGGKCKERKGFAEARAVLERYAADKPGRLVCVFAGDSHYNQDATLNGVRYLITQSYGWCGDSDCSPGGYRVNFDRTKDMFVDVLCLKPVSGEFKVLRVGARR